MMTDSEKLMQFIDYPYSEEVLRFINYIRQADVGAVVFMARKMYCLYMAAEKICQHLSSLREDRIIIQHNALPFFRDDLRGKRILLCDDIAISASSITRHRQLLIAEYGVPEKDIDVAVLFANEELKDDKKLNIRMDRAPIYLALGKVREISQAIVSFIWYAGVAYVAYLPSYEAPKGFLDDIQNSYEGFTDRWKRDDITSDSQNSFGVHAYCYTYQQPLGQSDFACVRVYHQETEAKITIVPFVMTPPISLDSLQNVYSRCEELFAAPASSDESIQMCRAKYRLINYIFSVEVLNRFLSDLSLDKGQLKYQDEPDRYSFPSPLSSLGNRLLGFDAWDGLWALMDHAVVAEDLASYIYDESLKDSEISAEQIVGALRSKADIRRFFGALSQYDKTTRVFEDGIPEIVLRKIVAPDNLKSYFVTLISIFDGAMATMNTCVKSNTAYSYLQKGEQAASIFLNDAAVSTSALSLLYELIGENQWKKHEGTIIELYKEFGKKKKSAILDDELFKILAETGFEGFYIGHYYDLYEKYGDRADEIEYFTCLSRILPEYLYDCKEASSVSGFKKYLDTSYPNDDMVNAFKLEVSTLAL